MTDWSQSLIPRQRQSELDELSQQHALMTHQPAGPNPAEPYLQGVRNFAGGFPSDALTGAFPQLHQSMPSWVDAIGRLFQTRASHDALNVIGGPPLLEIWKPAELVMLRQLYSGGNVPPSQIPFTMFPGRSARAIANKARELGLDQPPKPTPVDEMLQQGLTRREIAKKLGIAERTLRRYLNQDMYAPMGGPIKPGMPSFERTPSMPKFNFPEGETPMGDPEYERALEYFLRSNL